MFEPTYNACNRRTAALADLGAVLSRWLQLADGVVYSHRVMETENAC